MAQLPIRFVEHTDTINLTGGEQPAAKGHRTYTQATGTLIRELAHTLGNESAAQWHGLGMAYMAFASEQGLGQIHEL